MVQQRVLLRNERISIPVGNHAKRISDCINTIGLCAGAMFTGAINIRPDLNLGLYADYPYENIYGLSMKYIGWTEPSAAIYECCLSTEYAITV